MQSKQLSKPHTPPVGERPQRTQFQSVEHALRTARYVNRIERTRMFATALGMAAIIGLIAYMQHDDAQRQIIDEHQHGVPSIEQRQNYHENAREQLRLRALVASNNSAEGSR